MNNFKTSSDTIVIYKISYYNKKSDYKVWGNTV